ncbi:MAG: YwmB family TATA-box binding protein [Thermincolia bacterium]
MKKTAIIIILLALIIIGWQGPLKYTMGIYENKQEPLQGAFKVTGARFNDLTFSGWVQVSNRFSNEEELKNYATLLAEKLGGNKQVMEQMVHEESNFRSVILRGFIKPNTYLEIHSQTMEGAGEEESRAETYVTALLNSKDNDDQLLGKNKMEEGFGLISSKPAQVSTILSGIIDGSNSVSENKAIAEKAFESLGIKPFEGISNEGLVSLTGYSPEIREKLMMGEKELNINVALRYNRLENKTYVTIGSPIIATEY